MSKSRHLIAAAAALLLFPRGKPEMEEEEEGALIIVNLRQWWMPPSERDGIGECCCEGVGKGWRWWWRCLLLRVEEETGVGVVCSRSSCINLALVMTKTTKCHPWYIKHHNVWQQHLVSMIFIAVPTPTYGTKTTEPNMCVKWTAAENAELAGMQKTLLQRRLGTVPTSEIGAAGICETLHVVTDVLLIIVTCS